MSTLNGNSKQRIRSEISDKTIETPTKKLNYLRKRSSADQTTL